MICAPDSLGSVRKCRKNTYIKKYKPQWLDVKSPSLQTGAEHKLIFSYAFLALGFDTDDRFSFGLVHDHSSFIFIYGKETPELITNISKGIQL